MEDVRFRIDYLEIVVKDHIPNLPKKIKVLIKKAIEERLMTHPLEFGKPLQHSWKGHRRLRVGDYRIIYRIDVPKKMVTLVAIDHRKDVYDE